MRVDKTAHKSLAESYAVVLVLAGLPHNVLRLDSGHLEFDSIVLVKVAKRPRLDVQTHLFKQLGTPLFHGEELVLFKSLRGDHGVELFRSEVPPTSATVLDM